MVCRPAWSPTIWAGSSSCKGTFPSLTRTEVCVREGGSLHRLPSGKIFGEKSKIVVDNSRFCRYNKQAVLRETAPNQHARVVELADSLDSGSSVQYARAGSSPASRTKRSQALSGLGFFCFQETTVAQGLETPAPSLLRFHHYKLLSAKIQVKYHMTESNITRNLTRLFADPPEADYRSSRQLHRLQRSVLQPLYVDRPISSLTVCSIRPAAVHICLVY